MIKNKDDTNELTKSDLKKWKCWQIISLWYLPESQMETLLRKQQDVLTILRLACTIDPSMKLTIYKSPGPDGLHPRVLNELADTISIPSSITFKTSLTTGMLPTCQKNANVSAIRKKGNKQQAQNYRPLSLTSVVGKQTTSSELQTTQSDQRSRETNKLRTTDHSV